MGKRTIKKDDYELPSWVNKSGGEAAWRKWIDDRASSCQTRARKWIAKRGLKKRAPTKEEWRWAIVEAITKSEGLFHYSKWPMSLKRQGLRDSSSPMWPSLDHAKDPATINVKIESRLVNDMKNILKEEEFRRIVGHLAVTMGAKKKRIFDMPQLSRSYR